MGTLSVTAQVPKNDEKGQKQLGPCTIAVQCPDTAADMIKEYGDAAVHSNALANWKVVLQAGIRASLRAGQTDAQIQEKFVSAKMGVATQGGVVDAQAAYIAKFKSSTPEEQAKMLKELRQMANAAGKAA